MGAEKSARIQRARREADENLKEIPKRDRKETDKGPSTSRLVGLLLQSCGCVANLFNGYPPLEENNDANPSSSHV